MKPLKLIVPMLFLDDEADYASVNTNEDGEDPTAINKVIRNILKRFSKRSYVAYTATPFANIFINPESLLKMLSMIKIYFLKILFIQIGISK